MFSIRSDTSFFPFSKILCSIGREAGYQSQARHRGLPFPIRTFFQMIAKPPFALQRQAFGFSYQAAFRAGAAHASLPDRVSASSTRVETRGREQRGQVLVRQAARVCNGRSDTRVRHTSLHDSHRKRLPPLPSLSVGSTTSSPSLRRLNVLYFVSEP